MSAAKSICSFAGCRSHPTVLLTEHLTRVAVAMQDAASAWADEGKCPWFPRAPGPPEPVGGCCAFP